MKSSVRRIPRYARSSALPVVGLGLLSFAAPSVSALGESAAIGTTAQAVASAPQDTNPPAAAEKKIGEIVVVGNKSLNQVAIISFSGHKVGDPCTNEVLGQIRDNIAKSGYFGMHYPDQSDKWVRVQAEDAGNNLCKVTITVDENDPITSISISGAGPISTAEIAKLLPSIPGPGKPVHVYNVEELNRDVQNIIDLYVRRGYTIEFGDDFGMDPQNPGVLIVPIIVTRVDDIVISNKHKTKDYVILRELKTKKGDYFNRKTFQDRDRAALINLDLFEDVNIGDQLVGRGKVKLTISVVEKRTGSISAGVGYSNRQQLIGRAELSETNFGGRGEAVSLLWETGGAANRNSIELGYTRPWLDKQKTALQVNVFDKTVYRFSNSLSNSFQSTTGIAGTDNRYNEQRTGGTITLSRPVSDRVRAGITLRAENVRTDPLALSGVNTEIIQNGPIYSIGASLLRDTRDIIIDPVAGGYQNFSIQAGQADLKRIINANGYPISQSVTGNVSFSKGSLEFRQYLSLQGRRKKLTDEKSALAFRFILGSSLGTLPFFEQFFVGGAETLRGYREDRFWGRYMFLGSLELRQPLARRLKGVLFLDAGDAWGGSYSNVNIEGFTQSGFSPRFGAGLGIRVGTPLGPIRLDYGVGSEGARTHFSIGNVF